MTFGGALEKRLPQARGRLTPNAPLKPYSWMNAGGPAEVLFRPADHEDLVVFITDLPKDIPVTVLGVMSNVIIRDGGIPGVVIRLGREFANIAAEGEKIFAGAGALDMNVALFAADKGLAGLEFLSGIPGTVGGALRMNAGAYGTETKDVLEKAEVLFRDGEVKHLTPAEMEMSYRKNSLPDDVIFISASFHAKPGDTAEIRRNIDSIKTRRAETQPIKTKTGGSTFANPDGAKAWELIDKAGCRGLKVGDAQVSEMHCNFLINTGNASAADIERLGEEVKRRVLDNSGVSLRWEVKRIGLPLDADADILELAKKGG